MVESHNSPSLSDAATKREGSRKRAVAAPIVAIGTAIVASLCCIGPVLFVTLGLGAGLASRFEPVRPLFTVLTVALIAIGFYTVYGRRSAASTGSSCDADGACVIPRSRRRDRVLIWIAAVVAGIVLTFPQWSLLFLQ